MLSAGALGVLMQDAISGPVLRDFNGLRRHFRVGGDGGRRETLSIIRSAAPNRKERISSGENEAFREGDLKSLISLMAPNQPFR